MTIELFLPRRRRESTCAVLTVAYLAYFSLSVSAVLAETKPAGTLQIPAWAFDRGNAKVFANPDIYADYRDKDPELVAGDGGELSWVIQLETVHETSERGRPPASGGFVSIFDGKTLDGWHAVPKVSAVDWSVRDGVIVGRGSANRLSYLVWKEEHLTDFELELHYRVPGKGNTGVEIRSQPDLTGKRPFEGYHADLGHVGIGPHILGAWDFHFARRKEYPCPRGTRLIIDEDGKSHSSTIPGALTAADVRRGQWNNVRIVARGNHFQFFVNGKPASEFTDNAKRGRLDQGAIGLQIHDKDTQVEFKDVRMKRRIETIIRKHDSE